MALSYSKFTADGVDNVYPLVFPFLDKGHIKGQVDGEEVNLSVDTYYKRVTVTPVPKAGSLVVIRRRTPRDRTYSNFTGGNPFGQVNVNNSFLWQLYISQEISEGDVSDEFFTSNGLDMGGNRIFNLGGPKTDTDAVRVKDLDAAIDNLGDMAGSSISEMPPVDKVAGRRWTRCSDMKSFIWYVDNDGAQWVEDTPSMGGDDNLLVLADGTTTPRRLGDRFADVVNVKDFGAVGDGNNDTAAYQATATAASPLDRSVITLDVVNKYGSDLSPNNLIQNNVTGRLFNPKSAFKNSIFGMETLQHWFGKFADVSNKNNGNLVTAKVVCTGDSTTFGFHGSYGGVPAILSVIAQNRGYPNVTVVNNGRSAQATIPWPATGLTKSWKTTFLANDIAEDPDLLIVRWGANDPFYNVSPLGSSSGAPVDDQETVLAKVIAGYRETLSLLRNSVGMDVKNLSIILATPGPMNDVFFGRDEVYFQRLSDAMRQMALDYQCAYIDIYGLYSNSWGGVNDWYDGDATSGTARAIHPSDVLYEHIAGAIAELAFPDWGVDWKSNGVRNNSGTKGSLQGTNPPSSFVAGINIDRMGDGLGSSKGKPYNGTSVTVKQSDGATLQISSPLNSTLGAGISLRHGWDSTWNSYWNGAVYNVSDLVYQNGWSDFGGVFEVGSYKLSLDGTVNMGGVLKIGTTTSGTLLFTLPAGFRPSKNVIAYAATETGDCLLIIAPTGEVTITRFSGGAYIMLNTVSFSVY